MRCSAALRASSGSSCAWVIRRVVPGIASATSLRPLRPAVKTGTEARPSEQVSMGRGPGSLGLDLPSVEVSDSSR